MLVRFLLTFLLTCFARTTRAEIQYVIAISVDGLRGDFLQTFVETSPTEFPNFVRLRNTGAFTFNARCDFDFSETIPNHITMVTGRPVSQPAGLPNTWHHGYVNNLPPTGDTVHDDGNDSVPYKAGIFDVAHDRGLSTALYLGKTRLTILDTSYNATNGAVDVIGVDNGRDKIDFTLIQNQNTPPLITALTSRIGGSLDRFTFLHITDPDTAGHSSGWSSALGSAYRNSVKTVDGYLGAIFTALDARSALAGRYAILLTGDHGGGGGILTNHTDATLPENYVIPFFLMAPGIPANANLYEVFENRFDPAGGRPTYAAVQQPIRNGEIANLSAGLLGLPAVPGSYIAPELRKPLAIQLTGNEAELKWPMYLTGWTLESAENLLAQSWQPITSGISEVAGNFVHRTALTPNQRFFRLRRPTAP